MPADYTSTAQALSLPISPPASPRPSPTTSPTRMTTPSDTTTIPPWVRRQHPNSRRLSTPYSRGNHNSTDQTLAARLLHTTTKITSKTTKLFLALSPTQRLVAILASLALLSLTVLFIIFSHRIFASLEPIAEGWRALPAGWLIIWLLTFGTSFPPVIGYSTCVTVTGFVYGFPAGWPIAASATVLGSTAAFLSSRTIFAGYVHRLVGSDRRFLALGHVLRHDGVPVLAAIRLCPLPYSLSNGFLATIPSVSPWSFALATGLASPKLLVHIFIGSRLARLAESGDTMTPADRFINYASMAVGGVIGFAIGLVIYRRTMARAAELAVEEAEAGGENGGLMRDGGGSGSGDSDLEEGVVGRRRLGDEEDVDAAALMEDDDVSLWEVGGMGDAYTDDVDVHHETNGTGIKGGS